MVNTLGVYSITNNINNKVYIGESNNIERRWQEHKDELNTNSHHNYKLQNDWNTYGEQNFIFEILEEMQKLDKSYKTNMQLIYLEGKYIKQYDSISNGYNIEDTIEEILSGRKVIMKEKMDAKYLRNLIKNNGIDINYTKGKINGKKLMNCLGIYLELKNENYMLNFTQSMIYEILLSKNIFTRPKTSYYVKEEYIEKGYFINGKSKKNKDGDIQYQILITNTGKQFIIDTLNLKKNCNN